MLQQTAIMRMTIGLLPILVKSLEKSVNFMQMAKGAEPSKAERVQANKEKLGGREEGHGNLTRMQRLWSWFLSMDRAGL